MIYVICHSIETSYTVSCAYCYRFLTKCDPYFPDGLFYFILFLFIIIIVIIITL